ncbi:MAG: hypothetical protein SNH63_04800 [Rikenellaceae bacterium]
MKRVLLTVAALVCASVIVAKPTVTVSYVPITASETTATPIQIYDQPTEFGAVKSQITLYPQIKFQTLTGIGGCFNEIGGEALASLDRKAQRQVMESLFGEDGSAFTICRASIGSSDFGIDAYSFSEVAEDYEMKHFSLDREKRYMLPYIKSALKINPDMVLFGSPWSPPAWMKYSGYMDRGVEFPEKNFLRDEPRIYQAYALYFAKYVEGYRKEGVEVDRILVQNEPDLHTKYPSCRMPPEQMYDFVANYMRPLFEKRGLETQIWAGTLRTRGERQAAQIAAVPEYLKVFDGIGIQYMFPQYVNELRLMTGNTPIMHTESICSNGTNTAAMAKSRFEEMAGYINAGSENFCYWNMILNETSLSGWEWRQNSLIKIDRTSGQVTYNPDYAVVTLMSRTMRPGDVRIASYCNSTIITLFAPDGSYKLMLQNDGTSVAKHKITIGDETIFVELPAQSLCSVVISE